MFRRTFAEINIDHLQHNIQLIRKHLGPGRFLCPMVKANAYGHGDTVLAQILEKMGIQSVGVCLIEEGLLLRQFGVQARILVFRGFDRRGAAEMIQHRLTPVVSDWSQLQAIADVAPKQPESAFKIHLKFNTGMNRLGFLVSEAEKIFHFLSDKKHLKIEGVLTHLYEGENAFRPESSSQNQLLDFKKIKKIFSDPQICFHALSSGGFISEMICRSQGLKNILTEESWGIRPGLMIYGYNPVADDQIFDLRPVMSLKSHVNVFRHIKKNEGVSYNHTWRAERDSQIAVVPIGYADGFHRILSNQGFVLFQNQKVPIVGNICMDYLMLDVTDVMASTSESTEEEKEVTFFGFDSGGKLLSATEQAQKARTITWEILTSVGERVPRVYKSENPQWQEFL